MLRHKFKPAVPRRWLLVLAGMVWTVVGLGLGRMALVWLASEEMNLSLLLGITGLGLGLVIHRYKFSRLARMNIERICRSGDRPCIFAFQAWYTYPLIGLMIAFGVFLRHSSIPHTILAVIYTAIGTALFTGSLQYYRQIWRPGHDNVDC